MCFLTHAGLESDDRIDVTLGLHGGAQERGLKAKAGVMVSNAGNHPITFSNAAVVAMTKLHLCIEHLFVCSVEIGDICLMMLRVVNCHDFA